MAQLLERGKFNALFIADVLSGYDVYNGPRNFDAAARSGAQFPINDPHAVIPAMAAVTKILVLLLLQVLLLKHLIILLDVWLL